MKSCNEKDLYKHRKIDVKLMTGDDEHWNVKGLFLIIILIFNLYILFCSLSSHLSLISSSHIIASPYYNTSFFSFFFLYNREWNDIECLFVLPLLFNACHLFPPFSCSCSSFINISMETNMDYRGLFLVLPGIQQLD